MQISFCGLRPIRTGSLFNEKLFPACGPCFICKAAFHALDDGVDEFTFGAFRFRKSGNVPNIREAARIANTIAINIQSGIAGWAFGGVSGRMDPDDSV